MFRQTGSHGHQTCDISLPCLFAKMQLGQRNLDQRVLFLGKFAVYCMLLDILQESKDDPKNHF